MFYDLGWKLEVFLRGGSALFWVILRKHRKVAQTISFSSRITREELERLEHGVSQAQLGIEAIVYKSLLKINFSFVLSQMCSLKGVEFQLTRDSRS